MGLVVKLVRFFTGIHSFNSLTQRSGYYFPFNGSSEVSQFEVVNRVDRLIPFDLVLKAADEKPNVEASQRVDEIQKHNEQFTA